MQMHLYFQVRYVLLDVRRLELEITPVHACGRFHRHSWLHHKFLRQHNRDILMIAARPPQLRRGAVHHLNVKLQTARRSVVQSHQVQHPHTVVLSDRKRLQSAIKGAPRKLQLTLRNQSLQVLQHIETH